MRYIVSQIVIGTQRPRWGVTQDKLYVTNSHLVYEFGNKFQKPVKDMALWNHVFDYTRIRQQNGPSLLDLVLTEELFILDRSTYECPLERSDHLVLEFDVICHADRVRDICRPSRRTNYPEYQDKLSKRPSPNDIDESPPVHSYWTSFITYLTFNVQICFTSIATYISHHNSVRDKLSGSRQENMLREGSNVRTGLISVRAFELYGIMFWPCWGKSENSIHRRKSRRVRKTAMSPIYTSQIVIGTQRPRWGVTQDKLYVTNSHLVYEFGNKFQKPVTDMALWNHVFDYNRITQQNGPSLLDLVLTEELFILDRSTYECPLERSDHLVLEFDVICHADRVRDICRPSRRTNYPEYQDKLSKRPSPNDIDESPPVHSSWTSFITYLTFHVQICFTSIATYISHHNSVRDELSGSKQENMLREGSNVRTGLISVRAFELYGIMFWPCWGKSENIIHRRK